MISTNGKAVTTIFEEKKYLSVKEQKCPLIRYEFLFWWKENYVEDLRFQILKVQ